MVFKNNNNKILRKITSRSLKRNSLRNIFVILAIAMTTFMLTSVFTMCFSLVKNYGVFSNRVYGTTSNIILSNPSDTQLEQINSFTLIENYGMFVKTGDVVNKELKENNKEIGLIYADDVNYEEFIKPILSNIEGHYPVNENEIMISDSALEYLNIIDARIGDIVNLEFEINGTYKTGQYEIVGIFKENTLNKNRTTIYVSKDFVDLALLDKENDVAVFMYTSYQNRNKAVEDIESNIVLEENQVLEYRFDTNKSNFNTAVVVIAVILTAFFMFSGFLLIYNVMYISVINDINFYGLLKTVGTSPKQIKKIVSYQALWLSTIGIPIGLLMAYLMSFKLLGLLFSTLFGGDKRALMPTDVYFNLAIFICIVVFVQLTIYISCRKPSKIASNISPVEATKFTGIKSKSKNRIRKSTKGGKLYKMAWYNVFRDKRRAFVTFLSVFLGIMCYLCTSMFIEVLENRVTNLLNNNYPNDFNIYNTSINTDEETDYLSKDNIKTISNLEGVTEVYTRKLYPMQIEVREDIIKPVLLNKTATDENNVNDEFEKIVNNGEYVETTAMFLSDDYIDKIYADEEINVDIDAFKRGEIVLLNGWGYEYGDVKLEDNLKVESIDGEYHNEFKPVVARTEDNAFSTKYSYTTVPTIILSDNISYEIDDNMYVYDIGINCKPENEAYLNMYLKDFSNRYNLSFNSTSETLEYFEQSLLVMSAIGFGISVILILTGVLNFINSIVTSINSRQRELALLEAVGMTKKQIQKLLVYEGIYYALVTSVLVATVGMWIISGLNDIIVILDSNVSRTYPISQGIIIMIVILIICIITPKITYKLLSKENIVDRIRIKE